MSDKKKNILTPFFCLHTKILFLGELSDPPLFCYDMILRIYVLIHFNFKIVYVNKKIQNSFIVFIINKKYFLRHKHFTVEHFVY